MLGNLILLLASMGLLVFGVYLQVTLRRKTREEIAASPDGPRVVEHEGDHYFEDEIPS